jgi:hypothetical protein
MQLERETRQRANQRMYDWGLRLGRWWRTSAPGVRWLIGGLSALALGVGIYAGWQTMLWLLFFLALFTGLVGFLRLPLVTGITNIVWRLAVVALWLAACCAGIALFIWIASALPIPVAIILGAIIVAGAIVSTRGGSS